MIHYIYILIDPRDYRIRYVGQTYNLKKRYGEHCRKQRGVNHRACWLNKLHSLNLKPIMEIIEECDESGWTERETYWIRYYREAGYDLVNATDGGEGMAGYSLSEETRLKLSEARKGRKFTEEHKDKISKALKGMKRSDSQRKNISESQKGKKLTEEHKRKIGEASRNISDKTRRKLSEASRNKSDATRKKLSVAHKNNNYALGYRHTEEHKSKMSIESSGEKNKSAKLTEKDVMEIKELLVSGIRGKDIAKQYNISPTTISRIKHYRGWRYLNEG